MSLKNLFGKTSNKIVTSLTPESSSLEIESFELLNEELEERKKIIPYVDYTDPSNFAFYGSAEKYYIDAIQQIYKKYPYDGSEYEKIKWKKNASDLENYIFENEYPRNNGYVNIGYSYGLSSSNSNGYSNPIDKEYIHFKGGPNTAENIDNQKISSLFGYSNVYDSSKKRESNVEIDGVSGLTTEFWFKKNDSLGSQKQVILDVWNSASFGNQSYGRFRVEIHPGITGEENKFFIELMSGSNGIYNLEIGQELNLISSEWHHYSIAAINSGSNIQFKLYKDGLLNDTVVTGTNINKIYGSMLGWIGSLGTSVSGVYGTLGSGKLSGSLDEFRYWKTKRTDKQIAKYWFTNIAGGTNSDDSNVDLGIYYKFNEGIFNTSSINVKYDSKILDYSGRISNGYWTGYTLGSRETGSAIVLSNAADKEFKDPVVYSEHPDVISLINNKIEIGKLHDNSNTSFMYYTFPSWIAEQDQENSNKLLELSQILSSFFDELFIKIKNLPNLKSADYKEGRPFPYGMKLLESMGFVTEDLFTDSSLLENISNRTENFQYEDRIFNLKNHIYQNIYNNLIYIQRSKGTEKSIRNLLRCFGIDEELVKINMYSNDSEFTLDNYYTLGTTKKKFINFNDSDRFQGSIYQITSSTDSNSQSYVSGNSLFGFYGQTLECEVIFPLKFHPRDKFYFNTYFTTSSIMGFHQANPNFASDYTWYSSDTDLRIYSIRENLESSDGYICLTSSFLGVNLTSSLIKELYNNEKWNLSVRFRHEKYPFSDFILGGQEGKYILEFNALNTTQDSINNKIILTASLDKDLSENFFNSSKRFYAGSHRQNFTGSLLMNSDIKISSIRYWLSYLTDDVIEEHSKNPASFGTQTVYGFLPTLNNSLIQETNIPQIETLVFNWDFSQITSSDSGTGIGPSNSYDAKFFVEDISRNSSESFYGELGNVTKKNYPATGDFFFRNYSKMVEQVYLLSAKHKLPESISTSDMINILNEDEEIFTKDTMPINYYFAIEKSMYQTVSEEMLKFFGTIVDFNNLIGRPHYKYEREYRELIKLRELFFERIDNVPDLEKYVDYFKWIDSSINKMINQLIPASADFSDEISNLVESHILERNKYQHRLPSFEMNGEPPISSIKTIGELKYNWKYGHAPLNYKQNTNCLWWKERSEREEMINGIFKVLTTGYKKKFTDIVDFGISIESYKKMKTDSRLIKTATKIGSSEYLEIDVLKVLEKKDCSDE